MLLNPVLLIIQCLAAVTEDDPQSQPCLSLKKLALSEQVLLLKENKIKA